jgi:uncharacterized protein YgiM (DUF1202 family)
MAKKESVPNTRLVPFIIVSLITLIFLIWAMQQCNRNSGEYANAAEQAERESYLDSLSRIEEEKRIQAEAEARAEALLRARTQPLPGDSVVRIPVAEKIIERETILYSTIDGLNVRRGPSLKNSIIARLPLYEEVKFAGEVTDSLYEIDLGEVTPKAPWVRVELKDGKTGWVYGAGVSYYKTRLEGVIN